MKKIKLIGLFFIAFLLPIMLFTGCKANCPSDKQILSDLSDSLNVHLEEEYSGRFEFEMIVDKVAVETSMTGENMYTASLVAIAKNNYADYFWPAEVKYVKYDQGWSLLNCKWSEYTYEQVRYPNKSEIKQMVEELGLSDSQKGEISYEKEKINYCLETKADWSNYASGKATSVITWKYSYYDDSWEYLTTTNTNGTFKLTKELEGKWKLYSYNGKDAGYMIIENVTDTGFDVSVSGWEEQRFTKRHFELSSGTISYFKGGRLGLSFKKYDSTFYIELPKNPSKNNGTDLTFTFVSGSYVAIVINQSSKVK